jgi:hypothetical protein
MYLTGGLSLERIEAYMNVDQEPKATSAGEPPAYWPASGALEVENLRARYSSDGPEVDDIFIFTEIRYILTSCHLGVA